MDFLDPKEKRKRGIRLAIGYSLMAVLVGLATLILVFQAYGFDLDRRGHVVQNGLVFFDSRPDGASIVLNGEEQKQKTNIRLSVPEGKYDIELKKDGYLPWTNKMMLEGGSVERFYYPLLIPEKLTSKKLATFKQLPDIVLQSPDRRWILVNQPGSLTRFFRYDLGNLDNNGQPARESIAFPASLFSGPRGSHKLRLVEWSTDNKNILLKHLFRGGDEFILLNHDKPAESLNLDKTFSTDFDSLRLRDKKFDKYYIYSQKTNVLSTAALDGKSPEPLLRGVLAFSPHGSDKLLYTRLSPDGRNLRIVLRLGDNEYTVKELEGKPEVKVDLASFDGSWYTVFSVSPEKRAYVYKDPQDTISSDPERKPAPIMVLKLHETPRYLSFSGNASKVMISDGQEYSVYDIEYDNPYRFTLPDKLDRGNKPVWIDGHRLLARGSGDVLVFDFDGQNKHRLAASAPSLPAMFDRDYEHLYTLTSPKPTSAESVLQETNLRIDADLSGGLFN